MAENQHASEAVDLALLGHSPSPEQPPASSSPARGEIHAHPEPTTSLNDNEEKSPVFTASPRMALDTPSSTDQSSPEALILAWSIGVNSRVAVRSLQDAERKAVVYTCGRAVVLFDQEKHTQHILQGHANTVSCMCLSEDKRWLATADNGPGSTVIVWDTYSGIPVHTLFSCHPGEGVVAMAMSPDASYIITLGTAIPQRVCVWCWTVDSDVPVCSLELDPDWGYQTHVTFNISDHYHFLTNSETQAVFYQWSNNSIENHAPVLNDQTFARAVGPLTHSVFSQSCVLSGTAAGNLVVWSVPGCVPNVHTAAHGGGWKALKLLHLQDRPITTLELSDQFVVTGDSTGTIRYYDAQLRLLFWLQSPRGRVQDGSRCDKQQEVPGRLGTKTSGHGPAIGQAVVCMSFSAEPAFLQKGKSLPRDASLEAAAFVAREFVVSLRDGSAFHINPCLYPDSAACTPPSNLAPGPWCTALPGGLSGCVQSLAAHPGRPLVCMGTSRGTVILWDLDTQHDVALREFRTSVCSLAYDHQGNSLAIGFTDGCTRVVCGFSLADETLEPLTCQRPGQHEAHAVTRVCFSHDGRYLATSDTTHAVSVFVTVSASEWRLLGRQRAHSREICDMVFETQPDQQQDTQQDTYSPRLLSLGKDRILVEYGLSSNELSVLRFEHVEQSAVPLCLLFHPALSAETFLLTANNQHKYKLYNATTFMCRKTTLAPLLGSPLKKICDLPNTDNANKTHFLVFITNDCVGLQMLPLDGNPHHWVGVQCHALAADGNQSGAVAGGVQDVTRSHDGRFVITAGNADGAVHVWRVNTMALHAASALAGEGIVPFYSMLESGKEGDLFRELEDYFYFVQLQSQGLETLDVREVCDRVDLAHVPALMRALGHYPTQLEIEEMLNEVRFAHYAETGAFVTSLTLPEFLRLYLNHRPVEGPTLQNIRAALAKLGGGSHDRQINRSELLHALLNTGERMTEEELAECLSVLMSFKSPHQGDEAIEPQEVLQMALPETVTPEGFTEQVLGFTSP